MKKNLLSLFLAVFCCLSQVMAQTKTVTGKVVSANDGLPIPGASIKVKGTAVITVTNPDGKFKINASLGQVLVVSYIGMLAKEIPVTASNADITIQLTEDTKTLGEVVVTAYNIDRDKKSLGYSAPTIKGDEVSQTQREDFFGGLQGRVAGLSINSTSGNPGASAQIVLRGFVSLSGDNSALIVMDGVPINNSTLNQTNQLVSGAANRDLDYSNRAMDINPNDIESYTIMKGPEATALFGSAGASGAILITTKKGKAGRGSVNYTTSFRTERLNKFPQIQTVYNGGTNGVYASNTTVKGGPVFEPDTKLYDNIHNFFQTGFSQKHNLSFEGGSDKFTYRWSNEYTDTKGTVPTTSYTRFSTRLTGSAVISPLLKVTTTLNYVNSVNNKAYKGTNGFLIELMRYNPSYDVTQYQKPDGTRYLHLSGTTIYSEFDNPFWDVNKDPAQDKNDRIIANTNFLLTPNKWLSINAIFGTDVAFTNGSQVYNPQSYRGSGSSTSPTGGYILTYGQLTKIYNGSFTATAKKAFGSFNNTLIVGATFNDYNSNTNSQSGTHFYDPNFYTINNTLPTTRNALLYVNRYRNVGAFAQEIIGYKSLLYLTLSGRVDGSSKLMPSINAATGTTADAHPYFAYPSASLAFNFTDLKAVKDAVPMLDNGKLRISYALTGKEPWREYSLGTNYVGANSSGGGYALSYYGGNPDLKPETSKNFETGIEMQFFNNRFGIDVNYYNLISKNQIINPRLSYGSGFVLELLNGGTVRNRGVELTLTGAPVRTSKFNWNTTITFSHNKGIVLSLADQLPELYDSDTWVFGNVRSAAAPGYSTGTITGTHFDRNKAGQVLINPLTGLPSVGDATFTPIGDRTPIFNLGFTNSFNYKSFNLSFLWDFRYGGDVVNLTEYDSYTRGISTKTLDREIPRVITGVINDVFKDTDHPTPNTIAITPYYNTGYYTSTGSVEPGMFVEHNIKALRLRDVTLGYDLPQTLVKRLGFLQSAGVFLTVTDAVLITNYSGTDPESSSTNASSGGIGGYGIDYGNVGKPIGFNLGLRVKL